jgi:hypothetical protein
VQRPEQPTDSGSIGPRHRLARAIVALASKPPL